MRMFLLSACGLMLLSSTAVAAAAQHGPHAAHHRMAQAQTLAASPTEVQVPEVALLDAHGQPHDLQPLLQEGIVVVDFMYTRCTTICPALTAVMGSVQRELALRPRGKVTLISITLDPRHDTPRNCSISVGAYALASAGTGSPARLPISTGSCAASGCRSVVDRKTTAR
ncbi:SCO family protein [Xanthomonas hortorum pv. pelargonii]|nr:SCO family protein [Xanthomonas hortorum pv. pelargonii]